MAVRILILNLAMTVNDVYGLRNQGRVEEAYQLAREIYASDKSPYTSVAMFWAAADMLKKCVSECRTNEAMRIYMALERLLKGVKDEKGWMHDALEKSRTLLDKSDSREHQTYNGAEHLQTGAWGEELAVAYLREKGYVILEHDWRSKHRDIDIIARQGNCIVFVEVKTRTSSDFSDPVQAVNYKKQRNLILAINHYIHYRKIDAPWRFDVITIVGSKNTALPEINHIEDFQLL